MRFSILLITATVVVSANAASIEKRGISKPVQQCFSQLKDANLQLGIVQNAVDDFTEESGYYVALNIQHKEKVLEGILRDTNELCCRRITDDMTTEEVDAGTKIITPLITSATKVLKALENKKDQFDSIPLTTFLVVGDIKNMDQLTGTLIDCVSHKVPKDHFSTFRDLSHTLNDAFSSVRYKYGI
ncbi:hypothetical protein INT48_003062 [Thamnidium elegans]|uniref:Uncharacterized protein n=1 Tax=Thamnidium elegans TaxID=101142 RepID=A0A8H7VPH8_9FUNG|nr:hypothetical protein INT48_003062 [Thamnidium elegans]